MTNRERTKRPFFVWQTKNRLSAVW